MKNKFFIFTLILLNILTYQVAFATPSEIFIIRHADKLKNNPGPALSSKGMARSLKFASYFTKKWKDHIPDFIFATNPESNDAKKPRPLSMRQLQTVAPLISDLNQKYPDRTFEALHPYRNSDYKKLAELLNDKTYDGKRILICWDHGYIVELAKKLGVTSELKEWEKDNYDTVYHITYDQKGRASIEVLDNQYPISNTYNSWEKLYEKIEN